VVVGGGRKEKAKESEASKSFFLSSCLSTVVKWPLQGPLIRPLLFLLCLVHLGLPACPFLSLTHFQLFFSSR
jgi:hypothetical protein